MYIYGTLVMICKQSAFAPTLTAFLKLLLGRASQLMITQSSTWITWLLLVTESCLTGTVAEGRAGVAIDR